MKKLAILAGVAALCFAAPASAGKQGTISFDPAYVAGTNPVLVDACGFDQKDRYYVLVAHNTDPTASEQEWSWSSSNWWSTPNCLYGIGMYLPSGTWNLDVENSWGGGGSSVVSNTLTVTIP